MVEWLVVERRNACDGVRPDPWHEMDEWWDRVGRTLGRAWDVSSDGTSVVDVTVVANAYVFTTVVSGVRAADLCVEVRDRHGRVGIALRRNGSDRYYRATLPPEVDVEGIAAWLLDDLAVIRVPR